MAEPEDLGGPGLLSPVLANTRQVVTADAVHEGWQAEAVRRRRPRTGSARPRVTDGRASWIADPERGVSERVGQLAHVAGHTPRLWPPMVGNAVKVPRRGLPAGGVVPVRAGPSVSRCWPYAAKHGSWARSRETLDPGGPRSSQSSGDST